MLLSFLAMRPFYTTLCLSGWLALTLPLAPACAQSREAFKKQAAQASAAPAAAPKPAASPSPKVVYRDRPTVKVVYRDRPAEPATEAVPTFTSAAVWNDAGEVNKLGFAYSEGEGASQSYALAIRCYQRGVELGNVTSMINLGILSAYGRGTTQDYAKARYWYDRAATLGSTLAMLRIGYLYAEGQGTAKDHCEAMRWFRKCADAGGVTGMLVLGEYYMGNWCASIPKDLAEARRWFTKAIEAGSKANATEMQQEAAKRARENLAKLP